MWNLFQRDKPITIAPAGSALSPQQFQNPQNCNNETKNYWQFLITCFFMRRQTSD